MLGLDGRTVQAAQRKGNKATNQKPKTKTKQKDKQKPQTFLPMGMWPREKGCGGYQYALDSAQAVFAPSAHDR